MDSHPSFSLGLSQLYSQKQDIPVGFIPGTFDYEESNFAENRSKHRNDPATIKKLKEAGKILRFMMLEFVIIIDLKCTSDIDEYMYTSLAKSALLSKYFLDSGGFQSQKIVILLDGMPHVLNVWMFECCYEYSYKNLQPTSKEVRTLDLSFSKDFEIFNPISAASTFVAPTLKWFVNDDQPCIVTVAEDFDDFSTRPTWEFLRKTGLASPLSPEQASKRRKKDMFQEVNQGMMDGEKSTRAPSVRHVSGMFSENQEESIDKREIGMSKFDHRHQGKIGVSPEHEQLKFVPSASTTPEGTSKSTLDMEYIKTYVNTYEEKIIDQQQDPEEGSKKYDSPYKEDLPREDEDKGPVIKIRNDEPSVLQPLETEFQECVYTHTKCLTTTDVQREQKDENMVDKEEGRVEGSKNTYSIDMEDLSDKHMTDNKEGSGEELKIQHSLDMENLLDDFGGTITEFVQDIIDASLFGLSTPSTTKTLDVGIPNIVTESQWTSHNSQVSLDFLDAQVREHEATKAPVKRDRKKSRIFRSPYTTKFGSSSKDEGNYDTKEKHMYAFDGCTIYQKFPNQLILDYSQWLKVGLLKYHAGKDCGVFMAAYTEILSEGKQVHSCDFDDGSQRAQYASLLWHYGVTKAEKGYTSDNDDPPRPRNSYLQ
ncbi:uncharacterized protein LOC107851977 [Capsicum annuum]|uniref:uncharacterized protein LOC107851977 n=1 Tax=Capsicum annuum TaxID=4072 RepID=UPI001FB14A46|nr:uncharacterized protein LOC107851977 [Capsicum annuum]